MAEFQANKITDLGRLNTTRCAPGDQDNYGKWLYTRFWSPGSWCTSRERHQVWSLRCGATRLMTTMFLESICKLADEFCGGFFRFTTRTTSSSSSATSPRSSP